MIRLRVQYKILPNALEVVILDQAETTRGVGRILEVEGFSLISYDHPQITCDDLYLRGARRGADHRPAYHDLSNHPIDDKSLYIKRLAATICALNGTPIPKHLKPHGILQ